MKPEYQLKIEKLTDKEKILDGLMNSGYIVSCQQKFGHYEVSVYGKERVDGNGLKSSDWFEKMSKPHPSTTAYFGTGTITSTPDHTITVMNCSTDNVGISNETTEAFIKTINESVDSIRFGTREVLE